MALLNYTGKNVFGIVTKEGGIIRLLPGINEITQDDLEKVKIHPLFQARLQKGIVQIMHEKLQSDGKRSIQDMLNDIPQIFDVKLLKKIIDTDGRDQVIKAADNQLSKIKNPSKAKQKESEDGEHFA